MSYDFTEVTGQRDAVLISLHTVLEFVLAVFVIEDFQRWLFSVESLKNKKHTKPMLHFVSMEQL